MSHLVRPCSAMTIRLVNGFWRRSLPQMAVLVRQTPGFELTGLSCDAFHKTYGIILAIELGFMPFMLAGPYFGSRHDNVHDYPIMWLFHALKNYIYMIHLIYPCEISKFRAWARRCGWDVLVLSPFRPSFACFSDPCHLLVAKCAILCPDLQNFEITKYFIVSFSKSGDKIAHLAGVWCHISHGHLPPWRSLWPMARPPQNGQYSYRFSIKREKRGAWMISCSFLASLRYQVRLGSIL